MTSLNFATLVLIDASVSHLDRLIAGIRSDATVIVLDASRDGVEQISEQLADYQGIESLHIFSHGSPATLCLGSTELSANTLNDHASEIQRWGRSLAAKAEILLYGCNVAFGAAGRSFVEAIAQLTGATIAASSTRVGNADLGGNWNLDIQTGLVRSPQVLSTEAMQTYSAVLPKFDWSAIAWVTPAVYPDTQTFTANGISFTIKTTLIGTTDSTIVKTFNTNNTNYHGGYSAPPKTLVAEIDPAAFGQGIRVEVSFTPPLNNVYFEMYDVDKINTNVWQDKVTITGSDGIGTINPTFVASASPTYTTSGNSLTGSADSHNSNSNSGRGTVGVNFPSAITNFTIDFVDGPNAPANPDKHGIALLSNITFNTASPDTNNVTVDVTKDSIANIPGLSGSDVDGSVVAYKIMNIPTGGTLYFKNPNGNGSTAIGPGYVISAAEINQFFFKADPGFTGSSFTYAAMDNDGAIDISPAPVTLNSISNNPPNTLDTTVNTTPSNTVNLTGLSGTDLEGAATITGYRILTVPAVAVGKIYLGSVAVANEVKSGQFIPVAQLGNLIFKAASSYSGGSFKYAAIDDKGAEDSTPGIVTLGTGATNTPPTTSDVTNPIAPGSTTAITGLTGTDDGTIASYKITSLPDVADGTLLFNGNPVTVGQTIAVADLGNLTLQATPGFNGGSFGYAAIDNLGAEDPTPATVTLSVTSLPTVSFTTATQTQSEAAGTIAITAQLSAPSSQAVTVPFTLSGTASDGTDYTISSGFITIAAGNTTGSVTVTINNDLIDEADETIVATMGTPMNATQGAITTHTVTLTDNDPTPTVTLELTETSFNENGGVTTVIARLSNPSAQDVTINLGFINSGFNDSASESDYTRSNTIIVIPAGQTTGSITLTGVDDFTSEYDETIDIKVTSITNAIENETQQLTAIILDDDIPGVSIVPANEISVDVAEGGTTSAYTVVLNTQPIAPVTIIIQVDDQIQTNITELIFTPENWDQPQTVIVTAIDDASVEGDHTSIITHTVNSDSSGYSNDGEGIEVSAVDVNIADNDSPGVIIVPSDGSTNVTEGGASDTYTVVLTSKPTAPVTITLNHGSQTITDKTILTFDDTNWNVAQLVTVTAIDDLAVEGAHTDTITHTISTTDPDYQTVTIASVPVAITDNDTPGVTVNPTQLTTTEAGETASFSIVLNSAPTQDVTIALTNGDDTEGTLSVTQLLFTPTNWNQGQLVTVTGVNDSIDDGDIPYIITTTATSNDLAYNAIDVLDVAVTNLDDDGAGFTINPINLTTHENGSAGNFQIVLDSVPLAPVTLTLTNGDPTEGALSTIALTFTPENWNQPQSITVTGVDDNEVDGNIPYTITATASSSDPSYNSLSKSINVTNLDNDSPPVTNPPVTNDGAVSATPNSTLQLTGLGATDPEGDPIASYTISKLPPADQGILYVGDPTKGGVPIAIGQILNPSEISNLFFQTTANFTGGSSFQYTATDSTGNTDPTPATISLNLAPPIAPLSNTLPITVDTSHPNPIQPGSAISINGLTAIDPDGTIASFTITSLPPTDQGILCLGDPAQGGVAIAIGQKLTPDQLSQLFFHASLTFIGDTRFTYTATDDLGATDPSPATIVLASANRGDGCYEKPYQHQTGTFRKGRNRQDRLQGTNDSDRIFGHQGNDILRGQGDDDRVIGGLGNDRVYGQEGRDILVGGKNNDRLWGGSSSDFLRGDRGNDRLWGGTSADRMLGGRGNDRLLGQECHDTLKGGFGQDKLKGGSGQDHLNGNQGRDRLWGGNGNDTLRGGLQNDKLGGGRGNDRLNGGKGNDRLWGGDDNDLLMGNLNRDELWGSNGNDTLKGGFDRDTLRGGDGNDRLAGGQNNDFLGGGSGDDTLIGGLKHDRLWGRAGCDRIRGNSGNDWLDGGGQRDQAEDTLLGGLGRDSLIGGVGADVLTGGQGRDRFIYRSFRELGDIITDFQSSDVIDVSRVFANQKLAGSKPFRTLKFTQIGVDTLVQIDTNGKASGGLQSLATLENIATTTLKPSHFMF